MTILINLYTDLQDCQITRLPDYKKYILCTSLAIVDVQYQKWNVAHGSLETERVKTNKQKKPSSAVLMSQCGSFPHYTTICNILKCLTDFSFCS